MTIISARKPSGNSRERAFDSRAMLRGWHWLALMLLLALTRPVQAQDDFNPPPLFMQDDGGGDLARYLHIAGPPGPGGDWVLTEGEEMYLPEGNGNITVADPMDYPRIPFLDCDDPSSLFYTYRPNLIGQDIPDKWDFYNLIATNRSDFTDTTYTPGQGVTILESGYTAHRIWDQNTHFTRQNLPELMLRYGVTNEFELRFKWNGVFADAQHDLTTNATGMVFGGDDPILSICYELQQQDGFRPMLTYLGGSTVPGGTSNFSAQQLQPYSNFIFGWGLRRWLYLKYMFGANWSNTPVHAFAPAAAYGFSTTRENASNCSNSVSLLFQASKRVGGFMEWYALDSRGAQDDRQINFLDAGLFLYATTSVQWDVRYGRRISDRVNEDFAGLGFSTRW